MNLDSVWLRLKTSYEKNLPVLNAYRKRQYPDFVFDAHAKTVRDEIPVFTFHFVEPNQLKEQLQFLAVNNYQTLTTDELYQMITGIRPIAERGVLLTFDDGWEGLWTHGYPFLKKYGMRGVAFINPGLINESETYHANLLDVWEGRVCESGLSRRGGGKESLCSWCEIREMANSGVVEFQSHTMYHSLIFTGSDILDFFHPSFDTYINNHNVPIFQSNGQDSMERKAEWGMPIYAYSPRMAGKRRYFDDEKLRIQCIEFVRDNGGREYFRNRNWRKPLRQLVADYREQAGDNGYYESTEEQREAIYWDLAESKRMIQEKLPGRTVHHVCYPYFVGSRLAMELSKKAGYVCNYWGVLEGRRYNRPGDDPYRIVRLDEELIFRLPGHGRKSLWEVLGQRVVKDSRRFVRKLMRPDDRNSA